MSFLKSLNPGLAADIVIFMIILFKMLQGRSDGAVRKLGRLAALICAILGSEYIKKAFARVLSEKYIQPYVYNKMSVELDKLGLTDAVENLTSLFNNLKLPQFLQHSVADKVAGESIGTYPAVNTAVNSASSIIAERITGGIILILSFAAIYLLVKLLFDGMLDPVIRKLPIVSQANSVLGALIGGVTGVIIAGLLIIIVYKLAPSLSAGDNSIFSPKTVDSTYLLKLYFKALPSIFSY